MIISIKNIVIGTKSRDYALSDNYAKDKSGNIAYDKTGRPAKGKSQS